MTNEEFIKSVSLEGEEWRDVVGYEGLYKVSSFGRVIRLSKKSRNGTCEFTLKPSLRNAYDHFGYNYMKLVDYNGKYKAFFVHRLVANAFIENPNNYKEIDHINCNRKDNRVENLRWCNRSSNMLNPITRIKNSINKKGIKTWNTKPVVKLKDGILVAKYESGWDATKDGYAQTHISRCCRGLIKQYKGFQWMFLYDYETLINKSKNSLPTGYYPQ